MLRRISTSRLLVLIAVVLLALGGGTAIAIAALNGSGPTPPPKPLDTAVHDALTAPAVNGVTARIQFTNRLVDKSNLGGSSPLLSGATGRLWAASDGRLRLELQSQNGDAQITSDGRTVTVVDATQNQAWRITLPSHSGSSSAQTETPPTLARIDQALKQLTANANVSGATPSNVAGREAYTVRISPKRNGGLIGAAELAWDAAHGTPLRVAVYAKGDPAPVLELTATHISFGAVSSSELSAPIPAGTKVTNLDLSGAGADGAGTSPTATPPGNDVGTVASQLPFKPSAPPSLAGQSRTSIRAVSHGSDKAAIVTYGKGLGTIVVLEQPAGSAPAAPRPAGHGDHGIQLPTVSIRGAQGQQLSTALGTLVRFSRDGVQYTVVGSVPSAVALSAARAL